MDTHELLRLIHILSSAVLFGTGLGTAFAMLMAHRSTDVKAIAVVTRNVVLADWLFTTPAVIIQPATGLLLMDMAGFELTEPWLITSLGLYVFIGMCWLPVVWLQIRMRSLAAKADAQNTPLPDSYHKAMRIWFRLGWPAFISVMVIFWLMVSKPELW